MTDKQKAKHYFTEAMQALTHQQLQQAQQYLDTSIQTHPHYSPALTYRGIIKQLLGGTSLAIKDYDLAIRSDSKNAFAYANRGSAQHSLKNYPAAIKDLNKAIGFDPENSMAYLHLVITHTKLGECSHAKKDLLKLIKQSKMTPDKYSGTQPPLYQYTALHSQQLLTLINQQLSFTACSQQGRQQNNFQQIHPQHQHVAEHQHAAFNAALKQLNIQPHVCSLFYQADSQHLYSHFADSQQGVCIEYQLDFEDLRYEDLISYCNVNYQHILPIENLQDLYCHENGDR